MQKQQAHFYENGLCCFFTYSKVYTVTNINVLLGARLCMLQKLAVKLIYKYTGV